MRILLTACGRLLLYAFDLHCEMESGWTVVLVRLTAKGDEVIDSSEVEERRMYVYMR